MNGLSRGEFIGAASSPYGKLIGGAIVAAVISSVKPFRVIHNNEVGFRKKLGKVDRIPAPVPENAKRVTKALRKIRPKHDPDGRPIPKPLKPGLYATIPFSHSIEIVSTRADTIQLGDVTVERNEWKEVVPEDGQGEARRINTGNKIQSTLNAEVDCRVSPLGNNPYRAVEEVTNRVESTRRICREALGKAGLWIDDIKRVDPEYLTTIVNYHAHERLLEIGMELLHVSAIEDKRTFGEMVQTRGGYNSPFPPAIYGPQGNGNEDPGLHAVS